MVSNIHFFVDGYLGLIMVYFVKQKGDTFLAAKKYLVDITPYGSVKCINDNDMEFTENFETLQINNQIKHENQHHTLHTKMALQILTISI